MNIEHQEEITITISKKTKEVLQLSSLKSGIALEYLICKILDNFVEHYAEIRKQLMDELINSVDKLND